MQGVHREGELAPHGVIDTAAAVWLLGSVAGLYRRPFDAELVLKRLAPPVDFPALIEALRALKLNAGLTCWPEDDWSSVPLPAVVFVDEPNSQVPSAPEASNTLPKLHDSPRR